MESEAQLAVPEVVGAMILPGCVLYPRAMLPLYIFEPQYRQMLSVCLETHRIFAICLSQGEEHPEETVPIGAAGIVRACVANENGTSNLILQGLWRVRFETWLSDAPFPTARIKKLDSFVSSPADCEALRREALAMLARVSKETGKYPVYVLEMLEKSVDPSAFSDLAASIFVTSQPVRLRLLDELDATRRMEILVAYLTHLLATKN